MDILKRLRALIPPWNMPADRKQAVLWLLIWTLTLLVNFFWLPLLVAVIYQGALAWSAAGLSSALWSGLITLFIGLLIWFALRVAVTVISFVTNVSRVVSDVRKFQRATTYPPPPVNSFIRDTQREPASKVVEGTIIEITEEPQAPQQQKRSS